MARIGKPRHCAYCGSADPSTRDHVIPRSLYPDSKAKSRIQRITVAACEQCNQSWTNDEAHFRNMMVVAGEPNASVYELWHGQTQRSFLELDGERRLKDLFGQMVPIQTPEGQRRSKIYPAKDERVMRVVRKIIRGLCHHHKLFPHVLDDQVWADIQRFEVPSDFLDEMPSRHVEADIFKYRYGVIDDPDMHSGWLLHFFERTPFFAVVFRSVDGRKRHESESQLA